MAMYNDYPHPARPAPEQVFHEHAPRVYDLARRMLGNEADADDVTQDVLLQVVRKLNSFRGDAQFTTWLHRVTVNAALLHRRKAAQRAECQVGVPLDHLHEGSAYAGSPRRGPQPEQHALNRETRELIDKAIASLPPVYRNVYVLADVEGLANAEIGAQLGLRLAAVKSRLHRARRLMRAALAPYVMGRYAS
jgi:RNA polymerase sigma-70 factor (ECF subfamily)